MADVGPLGFDDLAWPDADELTLPVLPGFTPQMDTKELGEFDSGLDWPAYAFGLRRVFSPSSWNILPGFEGRSAHESVSLPGRKLVLVGYGEDPLVEAFWTRKRDLIPAIAEMGWDLVLAPNFSMYGNQPRAEHLINFRRNLSLAVQMRSAGIPAIPNIYWFRQEDLQRYVDWALDVDPPAIAINLQTFRTDPDWNTTALPGLTYLAHFLPDTIQLVAVGTSRVNRIAALTALFGTRLHLIGQNALMAARRGAVMTDTGRQDLGAAAADAFAANVRFYNSLIPKAGAQR